MNMRNKVTKYVHNLSLKSSKRNVNHCVDIDGIIHVGIRSSKEVT